MKGPADSDVQQTEVSGIPTFWAEGPPPFTGCLTFRVGLTDETFATLGLSHLVEHLTLSGLGRQPYSFNGSVDATFTRFHASGSRTEVVGFFAAVAKSLANLPLDRLGTEKRILATESLGAEPDIFARLLARRFGEQGFGLGASYEWALDGADAEQVAAWAATRFTAGNAVLWFDGPPPEELDLGLPSGERFPVSPPEPNPHLELPFYEEEGTGGVALSSLVRQSPAAYVGFGVAGVRAHEKLRLQQGHSYSAGAGYQRLDNEMAHVTLVADCEDRNAATVRDLLLTVVDELAEHGPTGEEIAWQADQERRRDEDPASIASFLNAVATDFLTGRERKGVPEAAAELEPLTPGEVASAVEEATSHIIVCVPKDTVADRPERFHAKPAPSTEPPLGTLHHPTPWWRQSGETTELWLSDEGVALKFDNGNQHPIRFSDCVCLIESLGGTMRLVERWGRALVLRPGIYTDADEVRQAVRTNIPDEMHVPLSERERDLLPEVQLQLGQENIDHLPIELDSLYTVLAADETVHHLAIATKNKRRGLLAVTSARVFFAFYGVEDEFWELARRDIESVTEKGLVTKRLRVKGNDASVEFEDVEPQGRQAEIAAAFDAD